MPTKKDQRPTVQELSSRLGQVERNVSLILSTLLPGRQVSPDNPESELPTPVHQTGRRPHLPTFSGETSVRHILNQVADNLDSISERNAEGGSTRSTPSPGIPGLDCDNDIRKILRNHDIELDRSQWDGLLTIFCDEIHVLYPFLHLPTLRNHLERCSEPTKPTSTSKSLNQRRIAGAQILLCLAIGKCTASPRLDSEEGRHSAGWSFYVAAMDLFGDLSACFDGCFDQILVLQTLALAVIYLFRLDILGKAEKLLALAISQAHHLGLHRLQTVTNHALSAFDTEMCRRLWWCLYLLDRRLAIDKGRPFVIQDMNVDTPLPRNLDASDAPKAPITFTPMAFLRAMVTYSRILGKVWEAMYSVSESRDPDSSSIRERLEHMLFRVQQEIPEGFSYQDSAEWRKSPFSPWWLIKQQVLMRTRWLSLHLLILKPTLRIPATTTTTSNPRQPAQENDIICIKLTSSIISEFNQAVEDTGASFAFTFPFLHYLISAAIISLGLILKEPVLKTTYGPTPLRAVELLEAFCRKTWVSGKLIRIVSRLREIARKVLGDPGHDSIKIHERSHRGSRMSLSHAAKGNPQAEVPMYRPPHSTTSTTTAPPTTNTTEFSPGNLVMTDFGFEENGLTHLSWVPYHGTPGQSLPGDTGPLGAGSEQPALALAQGVDSNDAQIRPRHEVGDEVVGEMGWLEDLFGDYLDSDLIIGGKSAF
ncbi:fungal-specific transcription factor domain-containing protein [Aspergillus californicus]